MWLYGQHIVIGLGDYEHVKSVALMVLEHYDIEQYNHTVFIIDARVPEDFLNAFPGFDRVIYYNLEHLEYNGTSDEIYSTVPHNCTEIWDFDIQNIQFYKTDIPVKFMPLRYTTALANKYTKPTDPKYTCGFVASFSKYYHHHRLDFLGDLCDKLCIPANRSEADGVSFNIIMGYDMDKIIPELNNCKFVLDTLSQKPDYCISQNHVRIFEHIILGHHVISEKSDGINYFQNLITQFETVDQLIDILKNTKPCDFSETYKNLTYSPEAYESFRNQIIQLYLTK